MRCICKKSEEYVGGELGVAEDGELFKDIISFMIVGLKQSIPCCKSPARKKLGEWLKSELLNCLNTSHKNEFNIRSVVCDNHASKCIYIRKQLTDCGQNEHDIFVILNGKKTYLFYDTVQQFVK